MNLPKVSVVIPTYNYRRFIRAAISSVTKQSYPIELIEIIIIDDGSTDETEEEIRDLIENKVVSYYPQSNKGKANATLRGIQISSGKYIFNLDADDFFLEEKIAKTVAVFEMDKSIVHVASPAKFYKESEKIFGETEKVFETLLGRPLDGKWLLQNFYDNNLLFGGGSTYAARGSILRAIPIPDDVDMYIDEFLILALLPFGMSYFLHEPLSVWRQHSSNYSGNWDSLEIKALKAKRLLKSSKAILDFVMNTNYKKEFIQVYKLRHATRDLSYKELIGNKGIGDIMEYASYLLINCKPNFLQLRKYHVFNRLIPIRIFLLLKKMKYFKIKRPF